jgi:hypothetical protein
VIDLLFDEKESVRKREKHLCGVYESVAVDRSTVGRSVKGVTASETEKAEVRALLL